MKNWIPFIATVLLCAITSCNKSDNKISELNKSEAPRSEYESGNQFKQVGTDSVAQFQKLPDEKQKKPDNDVPAPNPDWDKKIIKNAVLNLEVKDYNASYAALREKIRNLGGYIAQEEQTQSDYKIENSLVIKVPVAQFDNALAQLTSGSGKINERKITSEDVTAEYVDTRSRIEAKKQVRLRYLELLKQAKNMEEILNVQGEINSIQEEIESATGRVEYLGHSAAYSTINMTYYQVLNSSAKDTDKPVFSTRVSSAFATGWSWIVDLFVGIVSIWPVMLLIAAVIILYKRHKPIPSKQA